MAWTGRRRRHFGNFRSRAEAEKWIEQHDWLIKENQKPDVVSEEQPMGDLFIERRKEGDYAVRRANSDRASVTAKTQAEAIAAAKKLDPNATILVERVRDTKEGGRDKWRRQ
jgi:Uncharacterized protein conserved in bacteria (DUF2188)